MPNKKTIISKSVPTQGPVKPDSATLRNMAHHPLAVVAGANEAVLQRITELLTKLSPSNLYLVEGIIRCVLVEQENPVS